jgi:PPE-repeat protein
MWVQAATTMSTYQAVATTAVAAAPQTDPAPQIVNADDDSSASSDSGLLDIVDNDSGDPYDLSWWVNRFLEIPQTLSRDLTLIEHNPAAGFAQLLHDIIGLILDEFVHAIQVFQAFPQLLAAPFLVPAAAGGGLAALTSLAAIQPAAATPRPVPAAAMPPALTTAMATSPAVSAAAGAPAPSTAPTSAPAPAPATATATGGPPPPGGMEGAPFPYLVGGPTVGGNTGMSSSAQRKASEPDPAAAAAPAAASAPERQRARRRRRAAMKDRYREHEFMDVEPDAGPAPDLPQPAMSGAASVASDRGAGPLGFAGTARQDVTEAAGLTTLAGNEFGNGPSVPMLPGSWETEQPRNFSGPAAD